MGEGEVAGLKGGDSGRWQELLGDSGRWQSEGTYLPQRLTRHLYGKQDPDSGKFMFGGDRIPHPPHLPGLVHPLPRYPTRYDMSRFKGMKELLNFCFISHLSEKGQVTLKQN